MEKKINDERSLNWSISSLQLMESHGRFACKEEEEEEKLRGIDGGEGE